MSRTLLWWCRVNGHRTGSKSMSFDPAGKPPVVVHWHVCHCGLVFIDNWEVVK